MQYLLIRCAVGAVITGAALIVLSVVAIGLHKIHVELKVHKRLQLGSLTAEDTLAMTMQSQGPKTAANILRGVLPGMGLPPVILARSDEAYVPQTLSMGRV